MWLLCTHIVKTRLVTPMPLIDDIDLQDKLWVLTSQRLGLT